LREAILGGTLAPGERLPEVALARKLRTSRSPVREALRQLASEGLVKMVPGRGATVTRPDPALIREIFLVRNPLEATGARLAAEQRWIPDHRIRNSAESWVRSAASPPDRRLMGWGVDSALRTPHSALNRKGFPIWHSTS